MSMYIYIRIRKDSLDLYLAMSPVGLDCSHSAYAAELVARSVSFL